MAKRRRASKRTMRRKRVVKRRRSTKYAGAAINLKCEVTKNFINKSGWTEGEGENCRFGISWFKAYTPSEDFTQYIAPSMAHEFQTW